MSNKEPHIVKFSDLQKLNNTTFISKYKKFITPVCEWIYRTK
jgi:hypothetical protein